MRGLLGKLKEKKEGVSSVGYFKGVYTNFD